MNNDTKKYISKVAQNIADAYGIAVPITDIHEVVRKMGGDISASGEFGGTVMKTGEKSFLIRVHPCNEEHREIFAVSRELGHLVLHMGFLTNRECWGTQPVNEYREFTTDEQGYQATEFAWSLLMPEREFMAAVSETSDLINVVKLAGQFHVSAAAAASRCAFLLSQERRKKWG